MADTDTPPVGSDFRFEEPEGDPGFWVNSTTAGTQSNAGYALLTDGTFAMTFVSADTDGNGTDVRVRLFHSDGTPVGEDFRVSNTIAGNQTSPLLSGLNDGTLLVTWCTPDPDDAGNSLLMGRRFTADGAALSDEVRLSASGADGSYSFVQRSNGALLFAYQNDGEIVGRAFNASLAPLTGETQLNTTLTGTPTGIGISVLANGNYLLRFSSWDGTDGSGAGIRDRVFSGSDDAWSPVSINGFTDDFLVNTTTAGDQTAPRGSRLATGAFLEVWQSTDSGDGSGTTIRARLLGSNGDPTYASADFVFNTTVTGNQTAPNILNCGDWNRLVWWHSAEGAGDTIRGRWVNADGSIGASDFVIAQLPTSAGTSFSLNLLPDQTLIATYSGATAADGSGSDIQAVRIDGFGTLFPLTGPDSGVPFEPIVPGETYFTDTPLPSYDWDMAAAQISRNNAPFALGLGHAFAMTYSYRSSTAGLPTMTSGATGYSRFNPTQIAAAEKAIQLWEDLANISLVRVQDAGSIYSNTAQLTLWNYTGATAGSGPSNANGYGGYRQLNSVWQNFVYLNATKTLVTAPTQANEGVQTLLHEIGHAIGLSHPANYNVGPVGTFQAYGRDAIFHEDSKQFTVMSYFDENVTHGFDGAVGVATPMLYDIAAIQRLYGANMATRTGDTTYGFNNTSGRSEFGLTSADQQTAFAIWDAGGHDSLDLSGYADRQWIDLREEAYSSVGGLYNNIAIARGVTIEDAIGGSGDDQIRGNDADNRLTAGAGDDDMMGAGGNDTLDGGSGHDSARYGGNQRDTALHRNADGSWTATGPEGTDLLRGIEVVHFKDGDRSLKAVAADFGGTGTGDILFRGPDGTLSVWLIKGMSAEGGSVPTLPRIDAATKLAGIADFDGDCAADSLWRAADGSLAMARGDGAGHIAVQPIATISHDWAVVGTGDFDGDGKADILWRKSDGTLAEWRMDGATYLDGDNITRVDLAWTVAGVADFDGDGKADILRRNADGTASIWRMDGRSFLGGGGIGTPDAAWQVAGTGDFNGDGMADILWRHEDGSLSQWWMSGTTGIGGGTFSKVTADWKIAGLSDYDGDGRTDILWRNDDGSLVIWEMNGLGVKAASGLGNPGTDWLVA